jgi:hypothetical protein
MRALKAWPPGNPFQKSLFNIGSVSKTFVAYAVLHLAHEGRIHLNDSLIKYFPVFKNPEIGKNKLCTITHTSGLRQPPVQTDSLFYLTADDEQNWAPLLKHSFILNWVQYEYSNPCSMPWPDHTTGHGLNGRTTSNSKFSLQQGCPKHHTDGFTPVKRMPCLFLPDGQWKEQDLEKNPLQCRGNGGVWSSVHELALYEKAIRRTFLNGTSPGQEITYAGLAGQHPSQLGLSWFIGNLRDIPCIRIPDLGGLPQIM